MTLVSRDPHLRLALADGVLTLTLDRPARRNALTQGLYAALADAFDQASASEAVGAVLLHGEGGCFTAGNDLDDFTHAGSRRERAGHRFLHAIAGCTKPIVAAVAGHAVGVGVTLLLHCDFVLAARLASQPREALQATKALLKGPLGRTALQAIEDEYPTFERLLASPEAQQRIAVRRAGARPA